jgi:hypothetical protein
MITVYSYLKGISETLEVFKTPVGNTVDGLFCFISEGNAVPLIPVYSKGAVYGKSVDIQCFLRNLKSNTYPTDDTRLVELCNQVIKLRDFITHDSSGCELQEIQIDFLPSIVPEVSVKGLVAVTRFRLEFFR